MIWTYCAGGGGGGSSFSDSLNLETAILGGNYEVEGNSGSSQGIGQGGAQNETGANGAIYIRLVEP